MAIDFSNLSDQELYKKCQEYGKNARIWMRQFAALLPEVAKRELYKKYGFGSISEFAGRLAGMSQDAVTDVLRVSRKLEDKPCLKELMPKVGWNTLRVVANIATSETDEFWAEKIQNTTQSQLKIFVHEFMQQNQLSQSDSASVRVNPASKMVHHSFDLSPETDARLQKFKKKLEQELGESVNFEIVIKNLLDAVESEVKIDLKKEKLEAEKSAECRGSSVNRYIPEAIKKYLAHRYNGMCAFPNCRKTFDEYHHTRRFSLNKSHDPNFIVPLCRDHHQFAHTGLIENEELEPAQWRVRMESDKKSPKYFVDRKVQQKIQEFIRGG